MKKGIVATFSIIIFALLVYALVWYESYQRSNLYLEQANASFAAGDYTTALKGGEVYDQELGSYVFIAGYEHVLAIWSSDWAAPKPASYYQSQAKIDEIIYEKLTADQGIQIFKQYLNLSNDHLPEILIQSGNLYLQERELVKAQQTFELAIKAFGYKTEIRTEAEKKLTEIEQLQKTEDNQ